MHRLKFAILISVFWLPVISYTQSVAVNTDGSVADPSSILDVQSDAKGMLVPRMTKVQRNSISLPSKGLLVFVTDIDSTGFHYHDGTSWQWLEALEKAGWKTKGNTGMDTAVNFIGNLDDEPLRFKQNAQHMALWDLSKGNYFLGRQAGSFRLPTTTNSIAIGDSALSSPGVGTATSYNIAIGYKALRKHQSQIGNIAIGAFSMQNFISNPGGSFGSVSIGYAALLSLKDGAQNIALGPFAMQVDTSGSANIGIGGLSLGSKRSGMRNTAVGFQAGALLRVGNDNTFIGTQTNNNLTPDSLVNATAIGAFAQVDTSNAMVLGSINGINSGTANVNVGIGITKPKTPLHISKGSSGNNNTNTNRIVTLEDNANAYIQLLNPDDRESGILAGNASTLIKSGIIFPPDSSVRFLSGGNITRMTVQDDGNVGVNTIFPLSKLHVNGSLGTAIRMVTASTTLDVNDHTIIISSTSIGSVVISLPLVTTANGREYVIVNQSSNPQSTNFAFRDFFNAFISSIPANSSITLQGLGGFWYRTR